MTDDTPTVTIVDDDDSVRRALSRLLRASGYLVKTYSSAPEFLNDRFETEEGPGCLLIDVRMPELDGLELQARLNSEKNRSAVVFMTGHGDLVTGVKAMKSGAVDFLLKPFLDDELLNAVGRALERNAEVRVQRREIGELERREAKLTRREREVCTLVVQGRLNKQIAAMLGTSEKTVKVHRSRVMAKMEVASLAELVRIVERLSRARSSTEADNAGRPIGPSSNAILPHDASLEHRRTTG